MGLVIIVLAMFSVLWEVFPSHRYSTGRLSGLSSLLVTSILFLSLMVLVSIISLVSLVTLLSRRFSAAFLTTKTCWVAAALISLLTLRVVG